MGDQNFPIPIGNADEKTRSIQELQADARRLEQFIDDNEGAQPEKVTLANLELAVVELRIKADTETDADLRKRWQSDVSNAKDKLKLGQLKLAAEPLSDEQKVRVTELEDNIRRYEAEHESQ